MIVIVVVVLLKFVKVVSNEALQVVVPVPSARVEVKLVTTVLTVVTGTNVVHTVVLTD